MNNNNIFVAVVSLLLSSSGAQSGLGTSRYSSQLDKLRVYYYSTAMKKGKEKRVLPRYSQSKVWGLVVNINQIKSNKLYL